MITQRSLEKAHRYFKKRAGLLIRERKYADAVDSLKTASTIAQNYCLCYADRDTEKMLGRLARELVKIPEGVFEPSVRGRVIFYDAFSRDNVMLTTQYINALNRLGVEYMYLTLNPLSDIRSRKFYGSLTENGKAEVCAPEKALNVREQIGFIVKAVQKFRPEKVLIHTKAEDIAGILPWYVLKGVERYYIDVTDHSYWNGVGAIDYCVCFRNYGYSNAVKYRGLRPGQILMLPYYPSPAENPFEGLPESIPGSIKLFSGGRVTKILDRDNTFLNLIKRILEKYPNAEFYFAGGGLIDGAARMSEINRFIRENRLSDRFHLLGQRKDIMEVTRRMDIFINTFPFGGGLMVQIAADCGLPVMILSKDGLCASIGEFLKKDSRPEPPITFYSDNDFDNELERLMTDADYRKEVGERLSQCIVTADEFAKNLGDVLFKHRGVYQPTEHEVDYEIRRSINIEMEELVFHRYYGILLRSRVLRKHDPLGYLAALLLFVVRSDKAYLWGTVKRYLGKWRK